MTWIQQARTVPVLDVAAHLGLQTQSGAFGPCPLCGQERRGRQDRRLRCAVFGAGWNCHANGHSNPCDAKGDVISLVAAKELGRLKWSGLDSRHLREWFAARGLCDPYDGDRRPIVAPPTPTCPVKTEEEQRAEWDTAAQNAAALWHDALPVHHHPYLERKRIQPHVARLYGGRLLVPAMSVEGVLRSLQMIPAQGVKRFLPGSRYVGCFATLGRLAGPMVAVVEGFATGATIREATGLPVVVAFAADNLRNVAVRLRERYPDPHLLFCADDDAGKRVNAGVERANRAAAEVGAASVVLPDFGRGRAVGATDFNDLAAAAGLSAVRACVNRHLERVDA